MRSPRSSAPTQTAAFADYDRDGDLDLYVGGEASPHVPCRCHLYRRDGDRNVDVTDAAGVANERYAKGVAWGDVDGDGDQDVLEVIGGAYPGDAFRNALFENPGDGNHWVTLRLVGVDSPRCAIGARVTVVVRDGGAERRICRQVDQGGSFAGNPLRLTIGLSRADRIEAIEVRWPRSGSVQRFPGVPLDRGARLVEGRDAPEALALPALPIRRG